MPHIGFGQGDVLLCIVKGFDPDFQSQFQRLPDKHLVLAACDFHKQQISCFALRGDKTQLFRGDAVSVHLETDRWDFEGPFAARRDQILHHNTVTLAPAAVDDRGLRTLHWRASRTNITTINVGNGWLLVFRGVVNRELQHDRRANPGFLGREPHIDIGSGRRTAQATQRQCQQCKGCICGSCRFHLIHHGLIFAFPAFPRERHGASGLLI